MKKLKLFPKTYIFTMLLISMIILISHTLIYILLPTFYIGKKQNELTTITEVLAKELSTRSSKDSMKIADDFSKKYKLNIAINVGDEFKTFEGINSINLYIDSKTFKNNQVIVPNINEINLDNTLKDTLIHDDSKFHNNKEYFKIKNSSIIKNKDFKTLNKIDGNIKVSMDLESVNEARGVIFKILPISICISFIISTIASYIYTKIITDPIKEICDTTKKMQLLKKDARCRIYTGDEIELLSENINSLYKTLWSTIYNLEKEIKNVSKSEKMKVDFLRGASHELKTPLMSIHIMLENMILNIGKYKNHDIYLAKCKDEVSRLSTMIQDILDTSNLNTFAEQGEYKRVNIKNLLENTLRPYEITAKHKQININVKVLENLFVETDENLLTKALSNIISNAVNYTYEGKNINIYTNKKSLIIENECKPIDKKHLDNIFEAFYRAEFDRNKNTGGNGLGLYIVKQTLNALCIEYKFEAFENGMRFKIFFK